MLEASRFKAAPLFPPCLWLLEGHTIREFQPERWEGAPSHPVDLWGTPSCSSLAQGCPQAGQVSAGLLPAVTAMSPLGTSAPLQPGENPQPPEVLSASASASASASLVRVSSRREKVCEPCSCWGTAQLRAHPRVCCPL